MNSLEFEWRMGDYEIKACPRRLVRFSADEPNETIDFCKWSTDIDGSRYKFSVAYFRQDKDGDWDLYLVGDRFFKYVKKEDIPIVMDVLNACYNILNEFGGIED